MIRKLKEINYRLKIRKALGKASFEELRITKEEITREYARRSKEIKQYRKNVD